MAERSLLHSTDPLQLPPPQQIPTPNVKIINMTSSCHDINPPKSKYPRQQNNKNYPIYTQTSLQPLMPPIATTPLLSSIHAVNINIPDTNITDSNIQHTVTFHSKSLNNTINPYIPTTNSNSNFLAMEAKSSVIVSTSQPDDDQKITETIHISRDDDEMDDAVGAYIAAPNLNNIGGIPTTPGGPQPPLPLSVSAATPSLSLRGYYSTSQFMEAQQHRKRTSKLKFSRAKWSDHGKRVLLNTTVRVDRVCHTLVQTRQRFGVCPVEMRQLSLTVAVIERLMYGYGRQVQESKEKVRQSNARIAAAANKNSMSLSAQMQASISGGSHYTLDGNHGLLHPSHESEVIEVNSEDSVETIGKCTNPSIVTGATRSTPVIRPGSPINHNLLRSRRYPNQNQNINQHLLRSPQPQNYDEQLAWRHPGGVVSLLEILGRVLRSTDEQLLAIGKIASLTDFVQNNKLIWLISLAAGAYMFAVPLRGPIQFVLEELDKLSSFAIHRIAPNGLYKLIKTLINSLTNVFPSSMRHLLNKHITKLFKLFFHIFSKINRSQSASLWLIRFRFLILPTLIYMIHKSVLRVALMRLSKLQNELNSVILHWQLCQTAITAKNRLDQSLSDRLNTLKQENQGQHNNDNNIDIYQWILRLVPPSAHIDACFWYRANFRLQLLRKLMDVNYAVTCFYYRIFGSSRFLWPAAFPILLYYAFNPHRAACRANEFLANPDIRIIRVFYSILDSKLARWVTLKVFPKVRLMPQLQTAITFEIRVDDINLWHNDCGDGDDTAKKKKLHNIDTVRIKIFATEKLNIKPDYVSVAASDGADFLNEPIQSNLMQQNKMAANYQYPAHHLDSERSADGDGDTDSDLDLLSDCEPNLNRNVNRKQENGVIFYIHGGGFLGNFCASDLRILSQWSQLVNAPIVEVDYSLLPSKWPSQLQECILAYKCLCYGRLGFNARRIAVIGDSNGGGLAVSMILNIIQCGLRVPDVLVLTSPILSLRLAAPTTSRLLFNMDPLVPMNLIVQLTKYYLTPTICDDENDFLISPLIAAPDYLLSSFPPTSIVVGGLDPFLDDSIDFAHRLSNKDVNVDVKLKIYKFAPHAFLNFNYILPDVNHAIHLIAECIDQAFLS